MILHDWWFPVFCCFAFVLVLFVSMVLLSFKCNRRNTGCCITHYIHFFEQNWLKNSFSDGETTEFLSMGFQILAESTVT